MINKKSIWFLTLFSLILVLSVYYVTMPNELLLTSSGNYNVKSDDDAKTVSKETYDTEEKTTSTNETLSTEESEVLTSIRVKANEKYTEELEKLKEILTNKNSSTEEKNNAFEKMKTINNNRGKEEELEKKIKSELALDSCVIIDGTDVTVTTTKKEHNTKLANNVMRLIQKEFTSKMYITVKFQN